MALFGLLSTESFASERFTSIRRSVFYQYPNGAAPLLGLLSMLDGEVLNDPEFSWYEDRLAELVSTTVVNGTTSGAWYADSSGSLGSAMATTAADRTANTSAAYWLRVASLDPFRGNDIIKMKGLNVTGSTVDGQFRIAPNSSGVFSSSSGGFYIRVVPINTIVNVLNVYNQTDAATEVQVLGNANMQGQTGSSEGSYTIATRTGNNSQIFRTPMSFTGTALVTSAKFDEAGPYKDKAKKASMRHMIQMELQFLFGDPSKSIDTTSGLPTYTMGGIMFFLKLWEAGAGNAVAGVVSTYPVSASTSNSDDNKRIINVNGNITESALDDYFEKLFRHTNNVSNEKMAFCGSGFLNVLNKLYKSKVVFQADIPQADAYGMSVVKHVCPFGTIYYKTHPLFSRNAFMRYNALFLDVQNFKYRYMQGRDTDIKKNIQPNNADYRQDEFLTEAGLECQFPEANMYMVGVTGAA
jgi:hypothetical protein